MFCIYTELQKLEKNPDMNVDNKVSILVNLMNTLLDRFAPLKKSRKTATWYNKKIKSQINKQNQLFKIYKKKLMKTVQVTKSRESYLRKLLNMRRRNFMMPWLGLINRKKASSGISNNLQHEKGNICNVEPNVLKNFLQKTLKICLGHLNLLL